MKPLEWLADTREELKGFPRQVQKEIGLALMAAQLGDKAPSAKPLKGYRGGGVLEVVENHDGDTYRAVYTLKFQGVVFVLHVFKKKSKRGIATPKKELDLIRRRLKTVNDHYKSAY